MTNLWTPMIEFFSQARLEMLLFLIKIVMILGLAFAVNQLFRKGSASLRYKIWVATFLSLALFPLMPYSINVTSPDWVSQTTSTMPPPNFPVATPTFDLPAIGEQVAKPMAAKTAAKKSSMPLPSWTAIAIAIYLVGFAIGFLKLCWNLTSAWRQTRRGRKPTVSELNRLKQLSGTAAPGNLAKIAVICRENLMPRAWGFPRPVLLLPEQALTWSDQHLRHVLLHEWAHVRRQDFIFGLVVDLVALAYWPILPIWIARKNLALERERACDEAVLHEGTRASAYAEHLLTLACGIRGMGSGPANAMHFSGGSHLKARISSILNFKTRKDSRLQSWAMSLVLIAVGLSLAALTPVQKEPLERSKPAGFAAAPWLDQTVVDPETSPSSNEEVSSQAEGKADAEVVSRTSVEALPGMAPEFQSSVNPHEVEIADEQPTGDEETASEEGEVGAEETSSDEETASEEGASDDDWKTIPAVSFAQAAILNQDIEAIPELIALLGDMTPISKPKLQFFNFWEPAHKIWVQYSPGETAAIALASLGGPSVQPLMEALESPDPHVRRNACWAIGEIRGHENQDQATNPLINLLMQDSDIQVRRAAAYALGEIRSKHAVLPLLDALVEGRDPSLRSMAAWSLGEIRAKKAVLSLVDSVVNDQDWHVRKTAAWALGEIRAAKASEVLIIAMDDEHPSVRKMARWALSEIDDFEFDWD